MTEFDVDDAASFTPQTAGSSIHKEFWVPAEELEEFNAQIEGLIRVVATYAHKKKIDP